MPLERSSQMVKEADSRYDTSYAASVERAALKVLAHWGKLTLEINERRAKYTLDKFGDVLLQGLTAERSKGIWLH